MTLGTRIRALRDKSHIERQQLADGIGITYHALSKYETDEREPDFDVLLKLADYFQVTTDYLLSRTDNTVPPASLNLISEKQRNIPILGTIRAGLPILADENIEGYLDVPDSLEADYVLRVVGDSMIGAGIHENDYAICRKAEMAQSGQIVVALKDMSTGFSEATLKYYFEGNGDGPELRPANPSYHEIHIKDGFRIAGVMIALFRQEAPNYQIYRNYLAVNDHDEWTEVIDLANQAGLKVEQVREILTGQIEIAKRLQQSY